MKGTQQLDKLVIYAAGHNLDSIATNQHGFDVNLVSLHNNEVFFELLNQLDGLSYGDKKLAMEKWVSLDCGLLPSAFIGYAVPAEDLDSSLKEQFEIPEGYSGLVPVTEYCAIPSMEEGTWIGHTCASIIPGNGLGLKSKVLGLELFGVKKYIGVAQYDNIAVKTHTKIADIELLSATTPAHSDPDNTFIYTHEVTAQMLTNAGNRPEQPADFFVDPTNKSDLSNLQALIEEGNKPKIINPGHVYRENKLHIPIKLGD